MKKYKCFHLDDDQTAPIFLYVLKESHYLRRSGKVFDPDLSEENKGWNKITAQPIDIRYITSEYTDSGGVGWTFCEAFEYFREAKDEFDLYVLDLQLSEGYLNPVYEISPGLRLNECDEAKIYEPSKGSGGSIWNTEATAGCSFVRVAIETGRPCIIYSAKDKTADIRNALGLSTRGTCYIISISSSNFFLDDVQLREALGGIDSYFRRQQFKVIDLQPASKRKELVSRLKRFIQTGESNLVDIADISDDGKDNDPDKYWSLRTLFPRQVNIIEASREEASHGRLEAEGAEFEIIGVLEPDWRRLMSDGILNHPTNPKSTLPYWDISLAQDIARLLDFTYQGNKASYRPLTKLPAFENHNQLGNLRDSIIKGDASLPEYMIQYKGGISNEPVSCLEYFKSLPVWGDNCFGYEIISNWARELEYWARTIGIYLIDLAYISHIAYDNRRHLQRPDDDSQVLFAVCQESYVGEFPTKVTLIWHYPANAPLDVFSEDSKMCQKLASYHESPRVLGDAGYSDIGKIVCGRYRGMVEFRSGAKMLRAQAGAGVEITDAPRDSYANVVGTLLKVSIEMSDIQKQRLGDQ